MSQYDERRANYLHLNTAPSAAEIGAWNSRLITEAHPTTLQVSGPGILGGILINPLALDVKVTVYDCDDEQNIGTSNAVMEIRANAQFDGFVNCPIRCTRGIVIERSDATAHVTVQFL
jgi:hypothetical protein